MMKKKHKVSNRLGRGVLFHVAPSNVPINFAYSLAAGLLSGNANIVRLPSKSFPQVQIITSAFQDVLASDQFSRFAPYIVLLKYAHDDRMNEYLSSLCDVRIIWGGDDTISRIRHAPLSARSFDITFADRYSFCAISAEEYLAAGNPTEIAQKFYNDTYLFDQNACTAPHLVIWTGNASNIENAKNKFWAELHKTVLQQYELRPIQAVDKLMAFYKAAIALDVEHINMPDNLIMRVHLDKPAADIEKLRCSGGFFIEYSAKSIDEIVQFVSRKYQTLSYYGFNPEDLRKFVINSHLCGIDRIVPIGRTLDFSLNWDGYDLISTLSRKID
jgi:hypothetical protein